MCGSKCAWCHNSMPTEAGGWKCKFTSTCGNEVLLMVYIGAIIIMGIAFAIFINECERR